MPKIIVTKKDQPRQILPIHETIDRGNDVLEVVLDETPSDLEPKVLIFTRVTDRYYKTEGNGCTTDIDEAHRYPLSRALEIANRNRSLLLKIPPETR